jgi:hypothetical protein
MIEISFKNLKNLKGLKYLKTFKKPATTLSSTFLVDFF